MNNVFLFLFCISFLCIPISIVRAIINLIQKKTAKKRFVWAGISTLVLVISLVGFGITMDNTITSIELSISDYQPEYDINTEIPVSISVSPEYADISSLEYLSDGSTLTFSNTGILTGTAEGSFKIYAKSGDITSNTLTVNVIDFTSRAEAEAAELAKAEEEKQRAAEEKAAREAEEKAAAEQAAREAEEKAAAEQAAKEAEEKAAREAEEKKAAEQANRETVANLPETEPAPAPQPAEKPVQVVETQTLEVPVSGTAYLSATGTKYHSIDHCGNMNPNKARKTTVAEAEAAGYGRCSKCW